MAKVDVVDRVDLVDLRGKHSTRRSYADNAAPGSCI